MKRKKQQLHQRPKTQTTIRIKQRIILASSALLLAAAGTLVYLSYQKPADIFARDASGSTLSYKITDIHLQNRILRTAEDITRDQQRTMNGDSILIPSMPSRSAVEFKRTPQASDIN